MSRLTTAFVKSSNIKAGRHTDGDGLMLLVKKSGARSWVLRVQVDGTRRDIGIGSVNTMPAIENMPDDIPLLEKKMLTLAEARLKAAHLRQLAKAGRDVVAEQRRDKTPTPTFEGAAIATHKAKLPEWSDKTAKAFLSSLRQHAFPLLSNMRVSEIDAQMIADVLAPIWIAKPMIARKVRSRIGTVISYSEAKRWRDTPMPSKALSVLLPEQPDGGNLPAMPYKQVPAFVASMREGESAGRLALLFTIFTCARSGEVRGARWPQIDLNERLWHRPKELMKGRKAKAHTVTLNAPSLEILDIAARYRRNDTDLIFAGRSGKMLSDMALSSFMSGMAWTPHGFRSSFRDWAAEKMPKIPDPVAEAALSHVVADRVVAAYKRTNFIDMRRKLVDGWGQHCISDSQLGLEV